MGILRKLFGWAMGDVAAAPVEPSPGPHGFFSTHIDRRERVNVTEQVLGAMRAHQPKIVAEGAQDDSSDAGWGLKLQPSANGAVNSALMDWYASQGFIGWQSCALLMQQWLIDKAITMPARDATRNGWDNVRVDGEELDDEHAKLLKKFDKAYRVKWHGEQLVRMGRAFGIRLVMFKVDSTDPDYYENPFNPDGVTEDSYKGITQIDPYWCAPLLDANASGDPTSLHFYEPTYWQIGGQKVHRSHLIVFRTSEPPDVLKPMYNYGGIPVTQLIMERVYAAERTANEGPLLAQSKRTNVWLTDMTAFVSNAKAREKLAEWVEYRDNYGIKVGSKDDDKFEQFDTSLGDFDSVVMTQYQLVAAAAGVPATKLLGTTPKGFNATGEYEESNYHEMLESLQEHDLTPLIERHQLLALRSNGIKDVETTVTWRPLDAPTAAELAETNLKKAQTDAQLVQIGSIQAEDSHKRLASDPDSGYHQLGKDSELAKLGLSDEGIEAARTLGLAS